MSERKPEDPRDAHLVAALRHAPDRDVAPPAKVTAAILDHARRARRAPAVDAPSRWRVAWARLWQPAPMAAFGTLAMATLIGVMWSAQEAPEATPALRPAPTVAPAGDRAASVSAGPAGQAAEAPRPATVARESLPLERRVAEQKKPPPPNARPRAAAAAAPPTSPPEPAPAAVAPPDALAKSMADAAPARARSEVAAQALGAASPGSASPLARAGAEIDTAIGSDVSRVSWRVPGERQVAHGAAQRDWWAALGLATKGRWQPAVAGAAGVAGAASLVLLIDAAPRGTLAFEPQAVVWRDAQGAAWRAPIAPDILREWQEAIARW